MTQHLSPAPLRPALLSRLIAGADACERSFSITATGVEERVLFFFDHTEAAAALLAEAAQALDLPEGLLRDWSAKRPGADAVGLALRVDGTSVRLYTQYWELLLARLAQGLQQPIPLYAGFKALPDGSTRTDLYYPLPGAPRDTFMPPLTEALCRLGADRTAVETALAPLSADRCIYTVTAGDGRRSWLATLRRADLDPTTIAQVLGSLAADPRLGAVADCAARGPLLHVAGGEDRVKGAFTTLYFEIAPAEAEALLAPLAG